MTVPPETGPDVFLSCASADHNVHHFMARLRAQGVDVWNYQAQGSRIQPGQDIEIEIRRHVEAATTFIIALSSGALASSWVRAELSYALEIRQRRELHLLVLTDKSVGAPASWKKPFSSLAGIMSVPVNLQSMESVEQAIVDVCGALGKRYISPPKEITRAPYSKLLFEEFAQCLGDSPYEMAIYEQLTRLMIGFWESFRRNEWTHAAAQIDYFIQVAENEYPGRKLWYPQLWRATCDCLLLRFDAALDRLAKVELPEAQYPSPCRLRSSLLATRGYVHFQQGNYREAAACYWNAYQAHPEDKANQTNWVVAKLASGEPVDIEKEFSVIEKSALLEGDADRIEVMKARAHALAGNHTLARAGFERVIKTGREAPTLVVPYALYLAERGQPEKALAFMRSCVTAHPSAVEACLLFAMLCEENGEASAAATYLEDLRVRYVDHPMLQFQVLRGLWKINYRTQAVDAASALLARFGSHPPRQPDDFFAAGAANWITGRHCRAEYDFERSRRPAETWHYSRLFA